MPALRAFRTPANARLGQPPERPAQRIGALLEVSAQVRAAEAEDVPHRLTPAQPVEGRVVTGAASDEPAHRVADQRHLLERPRPVALPLIEQLASRRPLSEMWRPLL